ncbi:heavy-metal-associated domain-containing protein [Aliiroseovarius subalbicans]|uniref:heavy-metal-associated domain-containing protein n=1 Tax=Aliiroseovarius subalbicans TaxID=2925840 RepID=UPI001F5A0E02|nr:heavy-metal-associated domain-containing protein [Aliiroseovarius subalbicans]MCI2400005.1 heavy-metal-associated domain-containing protein [Aliiroseovarius subalbicans]
MTIFHVPDMSCGHCKAAIEDAVAQADAAAVLAFDMDARKVTITSQLDDAALGALLDAEGYPSNVQT